MTGLPLQKCFYIFLEMGQHYLQQPVTPLLYRDADNTVACTTDKQPHQICSTWVIVLFCFSA
jgi:hypothetical protein